MLPYDDYLAGRSGSGNAGGILDSSRSKTAPIADIFETEGR